MFPDDTFLYLKYYEWCMVLGVIAALVVGRVYGDKLKVSLRYERFCILLAVVAVLAGYGFAILFQAIYDYTETGVFTLDRSTGATFYGGLIGGALLFFLVYFTLGKKLCKDEIYSAFHYLLGVGACSIAIAHAIGRIGCFLGGCCYGKVTDSPIGVYFPHLQETRIPTQLFEAVFLFLLFGLLSFLLFRTKISGMAVYMVLYGAFRYVIEIWRDDERGASIIPTLTPSQFVSFLLVLLGAAILIAQFCKARKN